MSRLRSRLSWLAAAWLVCQAGSLAAAPLALCCGASLSSAADEDACCQGLAPGQTCPLHGHSKPADIAQANGPDQADRCAMRSACAPVDLALLSLAGGPAVLPSDGAFSVMVRSTPFAELSSPALSRVVLPESPPPRA
jgi:hypothetical protein